MAAFGRNDLAHLAKVSRQFYLDFMEFYARSADPQAAASIRDYTKRSLDLMLDAFNRGRKEGKVDLKYSDEFLLLYFESMIQGSHRRASMSGLCPIQSSGSR